MVPVMAPSRPTAPTEQLDASPALLMPVDVLPALAEVLPPPDELDPSMQSMQG